MATANLGNYLYENSNVMVNKPGIKDQSRLDAFERETTSYRLSEMKESPVKGQFDLPHMQAIHSRIYQDVYDWAGEVRNVNVSKGITQGGQITFTPFSDLNKGAADIQKTIKEANFLRGMDREEFSTKMADVYKKVNDLHPFREGNDRMAREFMNQLSESAGYHLNYSGISKQEWNYAANEAARGNLEPIGAAFKEISTPQRAAAFDKLDQNPALAIHPELDGAFKKYYEAETGGKDVDAERTLVSKELHRGKVVEGGVTPEESLKVIEHAAKARGLKTLDAGTGNLGTKHAGTVVAQSTHHMLLKVDDKTAIRFEKKSLDSNLQLKNGDKLTLQNQELKQDKGKEIAESKGMERSPTQRGG